MGFFVTVFSATRRFSATQRHHGNLLCGRFTGRGSKVNRPAAKEDRGDWGGVETGEILGDGRATFTGASGGVPPQGAAGGAGCDLAGSPRTKVSTAAAHTDTLAVAR
jgi:hypothetical protein